MRTALAARRRRFDMLLRIPTRTGFIWAQGGGTFTDYGADRRPTAVYGVFTDITALVEANEELNFQRAWASVSAKLIRASKTGMHLTELRSQMDSLLQKFAPPSQSAEGSPESS